MSLILDALKKSDNERKRQSTPAVTDVRSGESPRRPPTWLAWFVGLLVLNLIVLLFVLTRDNEPVTVAAIEPAPVSRAVDEIPPPDYSQARGEREPIRSLAAESQRRSASTAPPPATAAAAQTAPATTATAAAMQEFEASDERDLPTFGQLKANGALSLADLHIDLHVFAADPSRRLVFINGTKYTEGQTISEGAKVVAIRSDGVSLDHRGVEFLLPRE